MPRDGAVILRDLVGKLTVLRTSHQVIQRRFDSPRYYRPVIIFGAARDLAVIIKLEHRACPTTERQGGGFHFTMTPHGGSSLRPLRPSP